MSMTDVRRVLWITSEALPATAKHVLTVIAFHADKDGSRAPLKVSTIAAETGLCKRSVVLATSTLCTLGYVQISDCRGRGAFNTYTLNRTALPSEKGAARAPIKRRKDAGHAPIKDAARAPKEAEKGAGDSKKGCRRFHKRVQEMHPSYNKELTTTEPPLEPPRGRAEKSAPSPAALGDEQLLGLSRKPRKQKGRKSNRLHPAVLVARKYGMRPSRQQYPSIEGAVSYTIKDLLAWKRSCRDWIMHGWKPTNMAGCLERFKNGDLPGQRRAGNGKGATFTPAVERPTMEVIKL